MTLSFVLQQEPAQITAILDILETTVFLAVIPCRDLRRNNRYERRATIAGSNRVRKIAAPQLLQRLGFY